MSSIFFPLNDQHVLSLPLQTTGQVGGLDCKRCRQLVVFNSKLWKIHKVPHTGWVCVCVWQNVMNCALNSLSVLNLCRPARPQSRAWHGEEGQIQRSVTGRAARAANDRTRQVPHEIPHSWYCGGGARRKVNFFCIWVRKLHIQKYRNASCQVGGGRVSAGHWHVADRA